MPIDPWVEDVSADGYSTMTNSNYSGGQVYNLDESYLYISHLDQNLQY